MSAPFDTDIFDEWVFDGEVPSSPAHPRGPRNDYGMIHTGRATQRYRRDRQSYK